MSRELIEIETNDGGVEVLVNGDMLHLSVTNDWSGDTVTGFGGTESCMLTGEQAMTLAEFIIKHYGNKRGAE